MGEPRVELVWVACYECGDRNRAARRACSTCKGTGKVQKWVPVAPAPVAESGDPNP